MENLTAETFKEKVFDYAQKEDWSFKGTKPAVIDFYADWCQPCKTIAPILEELDTEYEGVDFYKVNTEEQQELAMAFGIKSIPSVLMIPVDELPQMVQGAVPKEVFIRAIGEILLGQEPELSGEQSEAVVEDKEEKIEE